MPISKWILNALQIMFLHKMSEIKFDNMLKEWKDKNYSNLFLSLLYTASEALNIETDDHGLESSSLSSLWPPFCLQDKYVSIIAWLVDLAWGNNNNY